MTFVSVRFIQVPVRNGDENTAALARGRDYLQVGANFPRPRRHIAQTVTRTAASVGMEAYPVVADFQAGGCADGVKGDGKFGGISVAEAVAHGLLGDMEELGCLGGRQAVGFGRMHVDLKLGWSRRRW